MFNKIKIKYIEIQDRFQQLKIVRRDSNRRILLGHQFRWTKNKVKRIRGNNWLGKWNKSQQRIECFEAKPFNYQILGVYNM